MLVKNPYISKKHDLIRVLNKEMDKYPQTEETKIKIVELKEELERIEHLCVVHLKKAMNRCSEGKHKDLQLGIDDFQRIVTQKR